MSDGRKYDFLIIGAGIIGSSVARELALRNIGPVAVCEKEHELGLHASGRNSGVLHSGINQKPGSLKARMCVEGNRRVRAFCKEHGVRLQECGTVVVSRNEREEATLKLLIEIGKEAGVEGLRIMDAEELAEREPAVAGEKALISPNGSIVDSEALVRAVAEDAKAKGVEYFLGAEVTAIRDGTVITCKGDFKAAHVINCAGLYTDRIARMMGAGRGYRIIPFRGDYMELHNCVVNSMVYQVPDLRYPFLGVHLTKRVAGEVLAGPTAMLSFGRESYDKQVRLAETLAMLASVNFWRLVSSAEFLRLVARNGRISFFDRAFLAEIRTLTPQARMKDIKPYRSGIRAQMVDRKGRMVDDMLVEFRGDSTHILNAVSPGMTAALAFAEYVVDNMKR